MIKLAVFDLDGTLLNTLGDISGAVNYALEKNGFDTYSETEILGFIGQGMKRLIFDALPEESRHDPEINQQVMSTYAAYYKENICRTTKPYLGIKDMLKWLDENNIKAAVLSNKPHSQTIEIMEVFFPTEFEIVLGQRKEVPAKPDPTGLIEILEHFNVTPKEMAYIGDSDVDMKTGLKVTPNTIGVTWGFRDRHVLEGAGAKLLADNTDQLVDILKSL